MPQAVYIPTDAGDMLPHASQCNVPLQVLESMGTESAALSYACLLADGSYSLVGASNVPDHSFFSLGEPLGPDTPRSLVLELHQELFEQWTGARRMPVPSASEHPAEMDLGTDVHFYGAWMRQRPAIAQPAPTSVVQRFVGGAILEAVPFRQPKDACLSEFYGALRQRDVSARSARSKVEAQALALVLNVVCEGLQDGFQEVYRSLELSSNLDQSICHLVRSASHQAALRSLQHSVDLALRNARTREEREMFAGAAGASYTGPLPVRFSLAQFIRNGVLGRM